MKRPTVSVIIPALNEEKYIGYCFKGLSEQTFKDFETIVVDGGSTDNTRAIAKKYAKVVIDTAKPGAGRARNTGARLAKGRYLIFLDADTMPSKGFISTCVERFKDRSVVAITGPVLPLEKTSMRIRAGYKFVSVYFVKFMLAIHRPSINGMNFAVRKSAFEKAGGFNENFITYEDWDLSRRLIKIGKIVFDKRAVVFTSARRVKKWGIVKFAKYHIGNMIRYALYKRPKDKYEIVR